MSPTEAKQDILLALAQLSLGRLLLNIAYLRFAGRIKWYRSNAAEETKRIHDILFALPCLRKLVVRSCYPLILLRSHDPNLTCSSDRASRRTRGPTAHHFAVTAPNALRWESTRSDWERLGLEQR